MRGSCFSDAAVLVCGTGQAGSGAQIRKPVAETCRGLAPSAFGRASRPVWEPSAGAVRRPAVTRVLYSKLYPVPRREARRRLTATDAVTRAAVPTKPKTGHNTQDLHYTSHYRRKARMHACASMPGDSLLENPVGPTEGPALPGPWPLKLSRHPAVTEAHVT